MKPRELDATESYQIERESLGTDRHPAALKVERLLSCSSRRSAPRSKAASR